jgi:hypothetical protein
MGVVGVLELEIELEGLVRDFDPDVIGARSQRLLRRHVYG